MLTAYAHRNQHLEELAQDDPADPVWIDLIEPSPAESGAVEKRLDLTLPTLADMQEIELSSRLYEEDGARFMTLIALFGLDTDEPVRTPVTFALKNGILVTQRYADIKTFIGYKKRATRSKAGPCDSGGLVMLGLLESMIDRLADALEQIASEIDLLSREVFRNRRGREKAKERDLEGLIGRIGRQGELINMIQESMVSLSRVVTYLSATETDERKVSRESRQRVKMMQRDATSLGEHAIFLSDKITFLLDATLGLITLEQNKIIKIFSIVSVFFMPPTMIASIYGMNFERMPELQWAAGYPYALGLMALFAVLPFLFFKGKGWM
ncbi:magnesium transporter CorA family protein [Aureimonas populi]|uniref:Magnesium transporter CorA family protein n=1 Tax=Aureimonas populi TaxID=1701758 RepID=A0ABW5CFG7_9HYPH|nr:magnesium transporter CorA family protein [Aureimonas populi]